MKLIPKQQRTFPTDHFSGIPKVENYMESTKQNIDNKLLCILQRPKHNLTQNNQNFKKGTSRDNNQTCWQETRHSITGLHETVHDNTRR